MRDGSCPHGYTEEDLQTLLGDRYQTFMHWMRGQTVSECDGFKYNHETSEYELSDCSNQPHGTIYYSHDVKRFLKGKPIID